MGRHSTLRLVLAAIGACFLVAASQPSCTRARAGQVDPRIIQVSPAVDADRDRIADSLARRAAEGRAVRLAGTRSLDLLVALDHRPTAADRDAAARAGARLLDSVSALIYSIRVELPVPGGNQVAALRRLAAMPGVRLIEENTVGRAVLYYSTRQTGARRAWSKYSTLGRSDHAIAILDTGLDDTHPDFPQEKLAAWKDFVGPDYLFPEPYGEPTDKYGHGTAVASVACGSGDAADIAITTGQLWISQGRCFHPQAGQGYPMYFPVDTTAYAGEATVDAELEWKDVEPGYTAHLCLTTPPPGPDACNSELSDGPQPLDVSLSVPAGVTGFDYFALPYADIAGEGEASAYWVQVKTPMSPIGDERNLMLGAAPGCRAVAVKVLDDQSYSDAWHVIQALEWVGMWRETYGIIAANMSFDFAERSLQAESTVDNLVGQGVVCVAAAGNRRGEDEPVMTSPARASKCITVAALNEMDQITSYSSYGNTGAADPNYKPDLAAPGGSVVTQRRIAAADSNDGELNYSPPPYAPTWWYEDECFPDDYVSEVGTSMSASHVAGAAALVAAALLGDSPGGTTLSPDQALRVKMLLLMTASETNSLAEELPHPTLDRASGVLPEPRGWDISEGYGRLNVDAAVEAALSPCMLPATWRATLGPAVEGQQVWARQVRLRGDVSEQFWLDNPPGADFDLYLYAYDPTPDGRPTIVASSTKAATGGSESFTFTPSETQYYYLVVKRITGAGEFAVGVITTSPRLGEGWHLISLPTQPVDPAPPAAFPGIPLDMRLYRYDPAIQSYVAYLDADPGAFGECSSHDGYWLYLITPAVISYLGMPSQCEQEISLPKAGWHLIGYPFRTSNVIENLDVLDKGPGGQRVPIRTAVEDLRWVELPMYSWSVDILSYVTHGLAGPPIDTSNQLDEWLGYWLDTCRTELALIMPIP